MIAEATEVANAYHSFEYLYPYPLADLCRRYRTAHKPINQLGYLLAASEASLKLLCGIAVAAMDTSNSDAIKEVLEALEAPSFGKWRHLLFHLIRMLNPSDSTEVAEGLRTLVPPKGSTSAFWPAIDRLVEERNAFVHSSAMTDEVALRTLTALTQVFQTAFSSLSFLVRCPLIWIEEVKLLRHPRCFEVIVRDCRGCNPLFPFEVWRMDEPLDPSLLYVLSPQLEKAYCVSPLVSRLEDHGGFTRFFFFNNLRSRP